MSRYVIWTDNLNLEIFVGFDDGIRGFFLTIANEQTHSDRPETYLFHNMVHHRGVRMTVNEVGSVLARFGIELPLALMVQLGADVGLGNKLMFDLFTGSSPPSFVAAAGGRVPEVEVLDWEEAS